MMVGKRRSKYIVTAKQNKTKQKKIGIIKKSTAILTAFQ